MKIFFDKIAVPDIDQAVRMYGEKEFQSPYRSTVASLSLLKHEAQRVALLLNDLHMPADCELHLEYTVPPRIGKGTPSHTDLMVIAGSSSLAVEAKWTEPRYKTVGEWLDEDTKPADPNDISNHKKVLSGWLEWLQTQATRTLNTDDFHGAIYQMVHRAASACAVGKKPALAYMVFKDTSQPPDPRTASVQDILADLTTLWTLLGSPKNFPFYVVEMPLTPTPVFNTIHILTKGRSTTSQQVTDKLTGTAPLFNFGKYSVTKV